MPVVCNGALSIRLVTDPVNDCQVKLSLMTLYYISWALFCPTKCCVHIMCHVLHCAGHSFMNSLVERNEEQRRAVEHIVCGTSRPAPYLIYGPPGTGKTFTLVEAIKQVMGDVDTLRAIVMRGRLLASLTQTVIYTCNIAALFYLSNLFMISNNILVKHIFSK